MVVLKEMVFTISTLGGYDGPDRTDFDYFYFGRCCSLERTDF